MKTKLPLLVLGFAGLLQTASGATVFQTLGVQGYNQGDFTTDVDFAAAHAGGAAPFDGNIYGNDFDTNFDQTFTFNAYGPVVASDASLFIGLYDNDSLGTGNQVLSFTAGAVDLTALLNAAFEGFQTDTDQVGYYTITLPSSVFADISDGSITFHLVLQNGLGIFGDTSNNGAGLDVATLTASTPEPASYAAMAIGLAALAGLRRLRARR